MSTSGRRALGAALLGITVVASGLLAASASAQEGAEGAALAPAEGYELVRQLTSDSRRDRTQAAEALVATGNPAWIPPLVDTLFFTPRHRRKEILEALGELAGEEREGYLEWVELVGQRTDLTPPEGYLAFKGTTFSRIDARYVHLLYDGAPLHIRAEEIVSGGVPLDGIPSVDDPQTVAAGEADFMRGEELVFGVRINGEARAYPRRVLSWHEMLNDVVGGEPITLSYCTLCGSAIVYSARTPENTRRTFGTSGFLYRSNKLMFDRQTLTLWSNLTGEAVLGRLAAEPRQTLPSYPVTLTTWDAWKSRHPDTRVMEVDWDAGQRLGFDYVPGAADRRRQGVEFPVWQQSNRLERNTEIYALTVDGRPKAYALDPLIGAGLVHDRVGETNLVLVVEPASGAVRVYERGERTFRRGEGPFELVDEGGLTWHIEEEALVPEQGPDTPAVAPMKRLSGHVAYWFGWYGFYPSTEVWEGPERSLAADGAGP